MNYYKHDGKVLRTKENLPYERINFKTWAEEHSKEDRALGFPNESMPLDAFEMEQWNEIKSSYPDGFLKIVPVKKQVVEPVKQEEVVVGEPVVEEPKKRRGRPKRNV